MDYYLNEYSLRGQYKDIDDFFESLRNYTLPVLQKIEAQKENIIWKKDTFWQLEICNGITLMQIPQRRNERSAEGTLLKMKLMKLVGEGPFWESDYISDLQIVEYKFDEEYRVSFGASNCFSKAIENEGRIVSFVHPNYNMVQLPIVIRNQASDTEYEYKLDNIYNAEWWKDEPEVKNWYISQKYLIQVRAREFEYHPPHFHAISSEFEAVFKLKDGGLYKDGKNKWNTKMISEVQEWYEEHKDELQTAWENIHNR